jgi:hypothetical protein
MTALRQHMIEDMQVRNLAPHTQSTYLKEISIPPPKAAFSGSAK